MSRPILLVEDSSDDVFFMRQAMEKAAITNPFYVVHDGQKAIEFLEKAISRTDSTVPVPCLVLLDLRLPRMPGLDVLSWIRHHEELKTVPVLILTASKDDKDIESAYRIGANSYFVKPSNTNTLLEIVKLIKEYWLKHCMPPPVCVQV